VTDAYLGGANVQSSVRFRSSVGAVQEVAMNNYYFSGVFKEVWLGRWGRLCGAALLVVMVLKAIV
jgi:hypothetical protein